MEGMAESLKDTTAGPSVSVGLPFPCQSPILTCCTGNCSAPFQDRLDILESKFKLQRSSRFSPDDLVLWIRHAMEEVEHADRVKLATFSLFCKDLLDSDLIENVDLIGGDLELRSARFLHLFGGV